VWRTAAARVGAALLLQARCRGAAARREATARRGAVVTLQAAFRGRHARRTVIAPKVAARARISAAGAAVRTGRVLPSVPISAPLLKLFCL